MSESPKVELERIYSQIDPSVIEQLEGEQWVSLPNTPMIDRAILLLEQIKQQDQSRFL